LNNQQLPSRESHLFRKLVRSYEQKQYKKGLNNARHILQKCPNHGETLAMKGLILNSLGKKEEAFENIRNGIKNNMSSHVVWHVYGLWQRSERKYDDAIKAYKKALTCEKVGEDSLTILRDLSLLQIQMRDLEGYKETRHQLFSLKPGQRQSWIGFAMSYHLLGDFDMALSVLEEFRKTQQERPTPSADKPFDNEHAEFLLYQNLVLREAKQYDDALRHIQVHEKDIFNKLAIAEIKYDLYMRTNAFDRAITILRDLIERNPENKKYYFMLEKSFNFSSIDEKMKFYESLIEKYPKADAPKQICLQYLTGDAFTKSIGQYLQRGFQKGVPSLFQSVKYLYAVPEKVQIIESLSTQYVENLQQHGTFLQPTSDDEEAEPTSTILWLHYFLAQHYDYLGNFEKAFAFIEKAIRDTPTLVELYMFKAKVFKHVGDFHTAATWMDEAQSMDTADRFVNCKCTKYFLRANQIQMALDMAGKFTRENSSPGDYLREMQCMWFELEMARSYRRLKKYGEALKKCHEIDRHFQEFVEDQFDFHSYCLRKMVLCAYVDMLNLEDHIKNHRFFRQAAQLAIEIYIRLYDHPISGQDDEKNENLANLSAADAKKLKSKNRKQQMREQQEKDKKLEAERRKKESQRHRNKDDGEEEKTKEDEFNAEKLERCEKPLDEAMRFLQPLEDFASNSIETHHLGFEVYYRRKKHLLMLRCLKRMKKLDSNDPKFHSCLMKFLHSVEKQPNQDERIRTLINEELKNFSLQQENLTKKIDELNEEFLKNNSNSLTHRAEAAKVMLLIDPENQSKTIEFLTKFDSNFTNQNLKTCSTIYEGLKSGDFGRIDSSTLEKYRQECHRLWPQANHFQTDLSQSPPPPSYSSALSETENVN